MKKITIITLYVISLTLFIYAPIKVLTNYTTGYHAEYLYWLVPYMIASTLLVNEKEKEEREND